MKSQEALTRVFVFAPAFLAFWPGASGGGSVSCSHDVSAYPSSQGLADICREPDEEIALGLDDGASFLQLSESFGRRVSAGVPSAPWMVHNTTVIANSSRRKSVLATQLAHAGKFSLWLERSRQRRETMEAIFGKTLTDRSRSSSKLVTVIIVAVAVLFGIALLVYITQIADESDTGASAGPVFKGNYMQQAQKETRDEMKFDGNYVQQAQQQTRDEMKFDGHMPARPPGERSSPALPSAQQRGRPPRQTASGTPTGPALVVANPRSPMPVLQPRVPAVVPSDSKFQVKVPQLLNVPPSEKEFFVLQHGSGEKLLMFTPTRCTPDASNSFEEFFVIALPDGTELGTCAFGRPRGPDLQCELYRKTEIRKSGDNDEDSAELFGIISADSSSQASLKIFTLFVTSSTPAKRALTVTVDGDIKDRNIRVTSCATSEPLAKTTKADGNFGGQSPSPRDSPRGNYYQVDCYPEADVILVVTALMVVERLYAAAAQDGHLKGT